MKDKYFYLEVIDHKDVNVWYSSIDIAGAEKFKSLDQLLTAFITHEIDHETIKEKMARMIELILQDANASSYIDRKCGYDSMIKEEA